MHASASASATVSQHAHGAPVLPLPQSELARVRGELLEQKELQKQRVTTRKQQEDIEGERSGGGKGVKGGTAYSWSCGS